MSPGEAKTVEILAVQAYGPYQENKVVEVSRDQFPPNFDLQIGQVLRMRKARGEKIRRIMTTLTETSVTLD
jgi:peptidylprolyl isomerase